MRLNSVAGLLLITVILFASLLPVVASDIFEAIENGDIETVKALIEKEPEIVNEKDPDGFTTPWSIPAMFGGNN